ncbi:MAG: flagellar biosynthesis anti-sigma factor FlgM [Pseudomonadota bacterium]
MSIDVRNIPGKSARASVPNTNRPSAEKATSSTEAKSAHADSVNLTDTAHNLKKAEQLLQSAPTVNSERVETISRTLANGEYQIDAERIAEKLLQIEGELAK